MNEKPKSKWYWRLLRWGLIGLAGLVTLAAVLITEENWRAKHQWQAYQSAAAARGEHIDLAWIVPPPVPDDQNFFGAPTVMEAMRIERLRATNEASVHEADRLRFKLERGDSARWPKSGGNWQMRTLNDLTPWQSYFRDYTKSPEGRTTGFPAAAAPQTPAADVLLALTDFGPAIDELRQASLRPAARLPMAYEKGLDDVNNLMPWLAVEKSWGRVLQLRTQAELQSGQSQAGLDDAKLSLRLADTLREQPFLISHLVRIALLEISVQPIYEGIAEHRWSDAQLADLETALASEDLLSDYQRAMRGERTCGIATLESWRITGKTESVGVNGKMVTQNLGWVPSAFFLRNEIAIVQRFDRFILPMADPTNRTISLGAFRAGQSEADRLTNHWTRFGSLYTVLADMSFPSVAGSVIKFAQTQEHLDLARAACALERYRLAHGSYPETLELAASLIDSMPHDIINGQPLHYRRTDDGGYVLYSVGWNESDDGGAVVLTKDGRIDAKKGDWVWQLPAK